MKKSPFLSLQWIDFAKGGIMAFLSATLTGVSQSLNQGHLPNSSDLTRAGIVGLTAFSAYLIKNLFTNSDDKLLKKENADA